MSTTDPTSGSTAPASSSAAIAQANAVAQQNATTQFSLNQGISSMAELQRVAPQVAKAMKEAICTNILTKMQDHMTRMKQLDRQAEQDAMGG